MHEQVRPQSKPKMNMQMDRKLFFFCTLCARLHTFRRSAYLLLLACTHSWWTFKLFVRALVTILTHLNYKIAMATASVTREMEEGLIIIIIATSFYILSACLEEGLVICKGHFLHARASCVNQVLLKFCKCRHSLLMHVFA